MARGYRRRGRFRYRLLALTIFYVVIAAAASFVVLLLLNNNASALAQKEAQQQAQAATPMPEPTITPSPSAAYAQKITGVPADAKDLLFSFDGSYCAYNNGSGLVVLDTAGNKTLKTITASGIAWAQFIEGRDILLYLTQEGNSIAVNTYNIGSDTEAKQVSVAVPANSKVKAAAFSSAKNFLCINVETGTGSFSDEVYTVDIMKRTARLTLQNIINNMVLLNKTEQVYYLDGKGVLYFGDKALADAGAGTLLGRDSRDNVYYQSTSDKSQVTVIADGKKAKTLQLADMMNVLRFYPAESSLYAVYDGYLVDLAGDGTVQIPFDKGLDFMGIGGTNAYFRNAAGEILGLPKLG